MKIKVEFDIPEEQIEYDLYINGPKFQSILYEVKNKIRTSLKYGHSYPSASAALEDLAELIRESEQDENVVNL